MAGGGGFGVVAEAARPAAGMVGVQVLFSVLNILIKLALNDGMDARVLVAYRFMFAVVVLSPIAFFVERYVTSSPESERCVTTCSCMQA
jgi:uncharacterized membrane protein SpoIIM required for sporulation